MLKVYDTDKEVLDLWFRYLKRNSIGGVGMKAQVWENVEFGFSSKEGEMITEEQLKQTQAEAGGRSEEEIEKAAKALMEKLTDEGAKAAQAAEATTSSSA